MIRLLCEREIGITSPHILKKAEIARRNFCLELSKYRNVKEIHQGSVNSLDLDIAENRYLLSGGSDSTIAIHDTQCLTGEKQQTYPSVCSVSHNRGSHKHSVETVQWYPVDTGLFTTSGADHQLKIWDTNTLKVADKFAFSGLVYCHHMSCIARRHCLIGVGAGRSTVKLVDLKSGSATHVLKGHDAAVYSVQWSSREEFLLATGGVDKRVMLWDVRRAKSTLMVLDQHNGKSAAGVKEGRTAHDGTVNSIRFTPDGLHLLTFGTDDIPRLWNTATGQNIAINYGKVTNEVKKALQVDVCASSSPVVMFVPSDCSIQVLDVFKGELIITLSGHYNVVSCCVSHPDTQYLFSGGTDRNILVWVPSTETEDNDDFLQESNKVHQDGRTRGKVSVLTADTWSSNEDDA